MSKLSFYRLEVKICVRRCCVCERSCHEGGCWTPCSSQSAPERSEDAATVLCLDWFPFQGVGFINYWNCKKNINASFIFRCLPGFLQICAPDQSCLRSKMPLPWLLKERAMLPHSFVVSLQCSKKSSSQKNGISVQNQLQRAQQNLRSKAGT